MQTSTLVSPSVWLVDSLSDIFVFIRVSSATNLLEVECVDVGIFVHKVVTICALDLDASELLTLVLNYFGLLITAKVLTITASIGLYATHVTGPLILHQYLILL